MNIEPIKTIVFSNYINERLELVERRIESGYYSNNMVIDKVIGSIIDIIV
jgi:hypothetical protein